MSISIRSMRQEAARANRTPAGGYVRDNKPEYCTHVSRTAPKGLAVKIDWTTAPTIKITINKNLHYRVHQVIKFGGQSELAQSHDMKFTAGMEIMLIAINDLPGYYYIVNANNNHCTCVSATVLADRVHVGMVAIEIYQHPEKLCKHVQMAINKTRHVVSESEHVDESIAA